MAKDCLILPASRSDLSIENRWAEVTVKLCKSDRARPWSQFCRGLAEYRQGHFANAVEWLQGCLGQAGDIHTRDVEAFMVLAMARHHLNQPVEAYDELAAGLKIADKELAKLESGPLPDSWKDWIIAQTLMREAKAEIQGAEASP
jgi:hypothetical protein